MNSLVNIVVSAPKKLKRDDDWVDRLSHRYTVIILVCFGLIIKLSLWVGSAITCWVPKHFTGSHTKYANAYCWVRNTYYLPYEEEIPKSHEEDKRHTILYYQWMPFILMGQAILFYLPSAVWHAFNQRAGVDCDNILDSAVQLSSAEKLTNRDKLLCLISNQMDRFLGARQVQRSDKGEMSLRNMISKTCCIACGRRTGSYLVMLYLFTKFLYIANIFSQLYILNSILRTSFLVYGVEFVRNMYLDDYWVNSKTFPRVTMCDFNVRRLGNVQRYTIQCVLPINMYTEKIYAFLWFWFFFLSVMTILNTLIWIGRFLVRSDRVQYIRNHLRLADVLDSDPRSLGLLREFVCDYLQQDGVFVMRMIGHNTNNITVTEIIGTLYTKFCEKRRKKNDDMPTPDSPSAPPMDEKKPLTTYPELPPN